MPKSDICVFDVAYKPLLALISVFIFFRGAFEAFVKAEVGVKRYKLEMKAKTVWGSPSRAAAHRGIVLMCWILSMLVWSTNTSAHEVMNSRYVFL